MIFYPRWQPSLLQIQPPTNPSQPISLHYNLPIQNPRSDATATNLPVLRQNSYYSQGASIANLERLTFSEAAAAGTQKQQYYYYQQGAAATQYKGTHNVELEGSNPDVVGVNDLLIVGPGVLGRLVAEKWKQDHPDSKIVGQTMTSDHHEELIRVGIQPSLRGRALGTRFPYVIFCAPPSRTDDYPGDIRLAASHWSGEGCFLFTSSTALYDCNDNGHCDEDTPVVPLGKNPRIDVLLKAENVVREVGGCTLRLAGLYKLDRGAHTFWLEKGTVPQRPDHVVNLIHYEDATSLVVAIMKKKFHGRTFLGCDNHPLSRQEIMDIVNKSGKFSKKFQAFAGNDGPLGKRMNNSKTRAEIGWEPKYKSFSRFMELSE